MTDEKFSREKFASRITEIAETTQGKRPDLIDMGPALTLPEDLPSDGPQAPILFRDSDFLERDEEFWGGHHQTLKDLREFCHGRGVSKYAVLGVLVTRALCTLSYRVQIPGLIGCPASLNFFLALVAGSGGGKDASLGAAKEFLAFDNYPTPNPNHPNSMSPVSDGVDWVSYKDVGSGTGEGIIEKYLKIDPEDKTKKIRNENVPSVLLTESEIDYAAAVGDRQGATLWSLLRNAWSGGTLSTTNADPTRQRHLEGGSYRFGLILNVQPDRSGTLLAGAGGGTPQRFLWMPATDPGRPPRASGKPYPHSQIKWIPKSLGGMTEVEVCPEAADYTVINADRHGRDEFLGTSPELGEFDGHANLVRLKLAVGLETLLNSFPAVTDWSWEAAGFLLEISGRTREFCKSGAARDLHRQGVELGAVQGAAEAHRKEASEEARAQGFLLLIPLWLSKAKREGGSNYPFTWSQAVRATASNKRGPHFLPSITLARDRLVAAGRMHAGWVIREEGNARKRVAVQAWVLPGDSGLVLPGDDPEVADLLAKQAQERAERAAESVRALKFND